MADMPIALYRLEVSKGAKLVLSYLWRYAGRERFVWVGRDTMAGDLGIESERTLRRLLGELRKAGVIEESVEFRQGKARPGWWLMGGREVSESDVVTKREIQPEDHAELESPGSACESRIRGREADRNDRARTEMAESAAKTDRARTRMAAPSAKTDRPFLLELPMNQNSLSDPTAVVDASSRGGSEHDRVRVGLDLLRRWRVDGGDPEGLGAWPMPTTPGGVALPRLTMGGKLEERLREERTAEEMHQAVHLLAELVEAGELATDKWRATYVFSGWLDELVVRAMELRAKRARGAERKRAPQPHREREGTIDVGFDGISRDSILDALAESTTLNLGNKNGLAPLRPMRGCSTPKPLELALVDLRIEVQAVAEHLGRTTEEVLRALNRGSMKELLLDDRQRLQQLLAAGQLEG